MLTDLEKNEGFKVFMTCGTIPPLYKQIEAATGRLYQKLL
jgi:hypothetical protein